MRTCQSTDMKEIISLRPTILQKYFLQSRELNPCVYQGFMNCEESNYQVF